MSFRGAGSFGFEVQNSLQRLVTCQGLDPNMQTWWFTGVIGYNFQIGQNFQLFPVVGAGRPVSTLMARMRAEQISSPETNFALSYGVGAKYYVWHNVAVRADIRQHHVPTRSRRRGGGNGQDRSRPPTCS